MCLPSLFQSCSQGFFSFMVKSKWKRLQPFPHIFHRKDIISTFFSWAFLLVFFVSKSFQAVSHLKTGDKPNNPLLSHRARKVKLFYLFKLIRVFPAKVENFFFRVQEPHPFPSSSSSFFCHRRRDSRFHKTLVEKTI